MKVRTVMVTRPARRRWIGATALAAPAFFVILAAPSATAEPDMPVEPQPPLAVPAETAPAAVSVAAPASPVPVDAVAAAAPPTEGVPHLPSPDSPPPGTTTAQTESPKLGYLRDLWHAVQTQDVTMSDALLLFAQRPMDAKAPLDRMSPAPQLVIPGAPMPDATGPAPAEQPAAGTPAPAAESPAPAAEVPVPAAEAPAPAAEVPAPAAEVPAPLVP